MIIFFISFWLTEISRKFPVVDDCKVEFWCSVQDNLLLSLFEEAPTTPSRETALSISDASSAEAERILKGSESMLSIDETPTIQRIGSTRRTPRFTTRRSNSLKKISRCEDFGPIDMHGYLDRKQELQV